MSSTVTFDTGGGRAARRDLVLAAVVVVGLSTLLSGPALWLVAGLLLAAIAVAALQVLGRADGPGVADGVPIESLILPAVAAIGCLGAIRLVPLGPWVGLALVATALLVDGALVLEERILRADPGLTPSDRSAVLVATLLIAFVGFTGAAAILPGGIAGAGLPGGPVGADGLPIPAGALSGPALLGLALADAVIAGLLGYRAAALRVTSLRDALWSAGTYAVAIAIGAAALRAMAIPRLVGPALLVLVFYLWDAFHGAPPSRRRDPRWIWQAILLVGLGVAVAAWNSRIPG